MATESPLVSGLFGLADTDLLRDGVPSTLHTVSTRASEPYVSRRMMDDAGGGGRAYPVTFVTDKPLTGTYYDGRVAKHGPAERAARAAAVNAEDAARLGSAGSRRSVPRGLGSVRSGPASSARSDPGRSRRFAGTSEARALSAFGATEGFGGSGLGDTGFGASGFGATGGSDFGFSASAPVPHVPTHSMRPLPNVAVIRSMLAKQMTTQIIPDREGEARRRAVRQSKAAKSMLLRKADPGVTMRLRLKRVADEQDAKRRKAAQEKLERTDRIKRLREQQKDYQMKHFADLQAKSAFRSKMKSAISAAHVKSRSERFQKEQAKLEDNLERAKAREMATQKLKNTEINELKKARAIAAKKAQDDRVAALQAAREKAAAEKAERERVELANKALRQKEEAALRAKIAERSRRDIAESVANATAAALETGAPVAPGAAGDTDTAKISSRRHDLPGAVAPSKAPSMRPGSRGSSRGGSRPTSRMAASIPGGVRSTEQLIDEVAEGVVVALGLQHEYGHPAVGRGTPVKSPGGRSPGSPGSPDVGSGTIAPRPLIPRHGVIKAGKSPKAGSRVNRFSETEARRQGGVTAGINRYGMASTATSTDSKSYPMSAMAPSRGAYSPVRHSKASAVPLPPALPFPSLPLPTTADHHTRSATIHITKEPLAQTSAVSSAVGFTPPTEESRRPGEATPLAAPVVQTGSFPPNFSPSVIQKRDQLELKRVLYGPPVRTGSLKAMATIGSLETDDELMDGKRIASRRSGHSSTHLSRLSLRAHAPPIGDVSPERPKSPLPKGPFGAAGLSTPKGGIKARSDFKLSPDPSSPPPRLSSPLAQGGAEIVSSISGIPGASDSRGEYVASTSVEADVGDSVSARK